MSKPKKGSRLRTATPQANILGGYTGCDPRIAQKAIDHGPDAIRSTAIRQHLIGNAIALRITLGAMTPIALEKLARVSGDHSTIDLPEFPDFPDDAEVDS